MDILSLMDLAAEVEDRAALLYHTFSRRFRETPAGCEFWERLSLEEKHHADTVRTYRRERLLLPVRPSVDAHVLERLETARSFLGERLRAADEDTFTLALSTAYRLEGILEHAHVDRAGEVHDPLLARLMVKLGAEDRHHLEMVVRMARSVSTT